MTDNLGVAPTRIGGIQAVHNRSTVPESTATKPEKEPNQHDEQSTFHRLLGGRGLGSQILQHSLRPINKIPRMAFLTYWSVKPVIRRSGNISTFSEVFQTGEDLKFRHQARNDTEQSDFETINFKVLGVSAVEVDRMSKRYVNFKPDEILTERISERVTLPSHRPPDVFLEMLYRASGRDAVELLMAGLVGPISVRHGPSSEVMHDMMSRDRTRKSPPVTFEDLQNWNGRFGAFAMSYRQVNYSANSPRLYEEEIMTVHRVLAEYCRDYKLGGYYLWCDGAMSNSWVSGKDWKTMGFVPYAVFQTVLLTEYVDGREYDTNRTWLRAELLLSSNSLGYLASTTSRFAEGDLNPNRTREDGYGSVLRSRGWYKRVGNHVAFLQALRMTCGGIWYGQLEDTVCYHAEDKKHLIAWSGLVAQCETLPELGYMISTGLNPPFCGMSARRQIGVIQSREFQTGASHNLCIGGRYGYQPWRPCEPGQYWGGTDAWIDQGQQKVPGLAGTGISWTYTGILSERAVKLRSSHGCVVLVSRRARYSLYPWAILEMDSRGNNPKRFKIPPEQNAGHHIRNELKEGRKESRTEFGNGTAINQAVSAALGTPHTVVWTVVEWLRKTSTMVGSSE